MKFSKRFREWREAQGVSGWAIEKHTGFSRSNLSSMEAGRYIPSDDVLKELTTVPNLDLTFTKLRAWRLLDEYTKEEILQALEETP